MRNILLTTITTLALIGCKTAESNYPIFPETPSRQAEEGFKWEIVKGAGMKFWAETNGRIHIVIDDSQGVAKIEWNDSVKTYRPVIRVFNIKDMNINDVLPQLKKLHTWTDSLTCGFRKTDSNRQGVSRYVLVPTGKYAAEIDSLGKTEPIPSTCNGWGIGNSGMRYFEIHDSRPDKALFVEIGQDAPLFDEQSIVFE
ncbi:hypothetical protein HPS57_14215 [Prevotella sp. PINT]|jgi:hypothetical protein|uniref:hypothetical protein n=1 Tax=Palleniella intestinalis TaxID=2736291 RepID=UPI001553B3C0|nr:hypothetical protein [Palleniella intestinalis]NPD83117.1 hypothetical protein [Palleniella intestinalis]